MTGVALCNGVFITDQCTESSSQCNQTKLYAGLAKQVSDDITFHVQSPSQGANLSLEMASCEADIRHSCEAFWSQENKTALENCFGHYSLVFNGTKRCKRMPNPDLLSFKMN